MFPIPKGKLSFREIADFWSREIQPPASRKELLALLEEAWWLGEIVGDAGFSRPELLKNMFKSKRLFPDIVFVTKDDAGPPIALSNLTGPS
jgi:hypothetical protein